MNLNDWFKRGLSEEEYVSGMTVNRDHMEIIASKYSLTDTNKAQILQSQNLRALVLTADWCGDAMVNLPIFMAIANEANIPVAYFIRDENLELMDQYLTNGTARSIPIIVLINENGEEVAKWGPRAETVQVMVEEGRSQLPAKEDPAHEAALKEFYGMLGQRYTSDASLWKAIEADMLQTFVQ